MGKKREFKEYKFKNFDGNDWGRKEKERKWRDG